MLVFEHCKKCKYYIQYYVRTGFHFRPAIGKCGCKARRSRHGELLEHCDFWEQTENTPEHTRKNAIQTIDEINNKLYEILEVLNLNKE